eukprot:618772-Rhodomonas_salina.2
MLCAAMPSTMRYFAMCYDVYYAMPLYGPSSARYWPGVRCHSCLSAWYTMRRTDPGYGRYCCTVWRTVSPTRCTVLTQGVTCSSGSLKNLLSPEKPKESSSPR